jgi:hypothetical protein
MIKSHAPSTTRPPTHFRRPLLDEHKDVSPNGGRRLKDFDIRMSKSRSRRIARVRIGWMERAREAVWIRAKKKALIHADGPSGRSWVVSVRLPRHHETRPLTRLLRKTAQTSRLLAIASGLAWFLLLEAVGHRRRPFQICGPAGRLVAKDLAVRLHIVRSRPDVNRRHRGFYSQTSNNALTAGILTLIIRTSATMLHTPAPS